MGTIDERVRGKLKRIRAERRRARLRRRAAHFGAELRPYHIEHVLEIQDLIGLKGQRVLEIGGDLQGHTARGMIALGAAHVTSINVDEDFDLGVSFPGIQRRHMDARALTFPDDSFDLIMGIAVLEHFLAFETVLDNCFRVLRPGGAVFFQGGPLWHSAKGHHCVVFDSQGEPLYHFARGFNPIEDWDHLLYSAESMKTHLVDEKHLPEGHAERVLDWVYRGDLINRTSWQRIVRTCEQSRFKLTGYHLINGTQPSADKAALLHQHLGEAANDCGIAGMTLTLRKTA